MKTLQYNSSVEKMETHRGSRDRNHHSVVNGRVLTKPGICFFRFAICSHIVMFSGIIECGEPFNSECSQITLLLYFCVSVCGW